MSTRRRPKKVQISSPMNFEHRIHAGFDPSSGEYHGLPKVKRAISSFSQLKDVPSQPEKPDDCKSLYLMHA